jgi:c-di-GMP-binding flagellar brake protein YcgR
MEMPAVLSDPSDEGVRLQLVDISLGGVGMFIQRGPDVSVGDEMKLSMKLADETVEVSGIVRHLSNEGALAGLEFQNVTPETHDVINAYVSELAERGNMA